MPRKLNDVRVPSFAARLTPAELATAVTVDGDTLSALIAEALGEPDTQPDALPRAQPGATIWRAPAMVLDDGDAWDALDAEGRGRAVRGALQRLAAHRAEGRYVPSEGRYPGDIYLAQRLSAGPDAWVQRAAWRDKQGAARAGNRPGEPLKASEVDLPGGGRALLWEVWRGAELAGVIAAPSLFGAASRVAAGGDVDHPAALLWEREQQRRLRRVEG